MTYLQEMRRAEAARVTAEQVEEDAAELEELGEGTDVEELVRALLNGEQEQDTELSAITMQAVRAYDRVGGGISGALKAAQYLAARADALGWDYARRVDARDRFMTAVRS